MLVFVLKACFWTKLVDSAYVECPHQMSPPTIRGCWHSSLQWEFLANNLLRAPIQLRIQFNLLSQHSIRFTVRHMTLRNISIQFGIHNQKCNSILNSIQYLKFLPSIQIMIQIFTSSHYGLKKIKFLSTNLKFDPEKEALGRLHRQHLSYKSVLFAD